MELNIQVWATAITEPEVEAVVDSEVLLEAVEFSTLRVRPVVVFRARMDLLRMDIGMISKGLNDKRNEREF